MPSSNEPTAKTGLRGKHPVLFVFALLLAAMALSVGAMAFFPADGQDDDDFPLSWFDSEKLGVVQIEGTIESSRRVVAFVRKLRDDKAVKGVLLRVDSGGGGFGPSQEIHRAVRDLARHKPVVASFGSVAASGGYYVACPAKVIYALPGSITGSIGVRSMFPNVREATDRLGLAFHSFTTGTLKDAGSPFRDMTAEDKAYLQELITDLRDIFVADVAQSRNLDPAAVNALQGKAMTAANALTLGLVDKMGSAEDALEELRTLSGITRRKPGIVRGPRKEQSRMEEFFGQLGQAFVRGMVQERQDVRIRAE
ncbi:Putative signal peptide peptidase SppA [Fundidesulfovibrio magnetotacticus]|uniref:Signal peptide peptidase SppA n=1 Tax=Fundidesulfovibrio magnetotacticus TaxID=2730080 RepID=A0A6V8LUV3_9BACT|nr:signal peptide peptidase SppA [Fundidesulfovibrio magnetotacticus]GFK93596.1 Putative signal peptide peptidase SppA [Fundidesulfovibrio magnetotacticus]